MGKLKLVSSKQIETFHLENVGNPARFRFETFLSSQFISNQTIEQNSKNFRKHAFIAQSFFFSPQKKESRGWSSSLCVCRNMMLDLSTENPVRLTGMPRLGSLDPGCDMKLCKKNPTEAGRGYPQAVCLG